MPARHSCGPVPGKRSGLPRACRVLCAAAVSVVGQGLECFSAVLQLRARVGARGLDLSVPEDVGHQPQIMAVLAHQPRRDACADSCRPARAITAVTILLTDRADSRAPTRESHTGPPSISAALGCSRRSATSSRRHPCPMRNARRRLEHELAARTRWFLLIAALAQLAKFAYPAAHLARRGVAAKTLVVFGTWRWVAPPLQRWSAKVERERVTAHAELRVEFGREPTDEQLYRALASARGERRGAGRSACGW